MHFYYFLRFFVLFRFVFFNIFTYYYVLFFMIFYFFCRQIPFYDGRMEKSRLIFSFLPRISYDKAFDFFINCVYNVHDTKRIKNRTRSIIIL